MFGVRRHIVAMCLTWGMINLAGFSSSFSTPGKPTNLQVTSIRGRRITLKWKKPLTTAGTPDNSTLSYIVRYIFTAVGSSPQNQRLTVTTESAQFDLLFDKQYTYSIYVKAVRPGDHQTQGDWSDALKINTKDLVPAKPTNIQVDNVKGFIITVVWAKPRTTKKGITDTSTLGYYVKYKNVERKTNRQIQSSTERAPLHLKANSRYEINVRAFKTFDTSVVGPWSDPFTLKTNESVPSKPPANVKVVSRTLSSIKVTWGPIPKDGSNGVILGYVVFYREQGASQWSDRDVKLVYSLDLTGLTTGKTYSVRVAGYTKIGQGIKSTPRGIIVGGQFLTTTKEITSQNPTTPKAKSTSAPTKQTIKITTKSAKTSTVSETNPTTVPEKPHSTSTKPSRTGSVLVGTSTSVPTEGSHKTTDVFSTDPHTRTSTYSSGEAAAKPSVSTMHPSDQSSPAVAAVGEADGESKENFSNKIMMIGAPVAGGLLLLIILVIVFVSSIRRSRRRKQLQQNGEIPMNIIKPKRKRKKSKNVVTRGAYSVTYEPPSGNSTLAGDSMTVGRLETADEPDQPVIIVQQPNETLPRTEAEDAPLLAAGDSDKYDHLRVDLSAQQGKLEEDRGSGLYDSIGSLKKAGCSVAEKAADAGKSDDEERYVTQEQIDATRDKTQAQAAPHDGHYKRPKAEPHHKRPKAEVANYVPHGNTYENLPNTDHLYEALGVENPEDPVYENTRASSSNRDNADRSGGYEPIPDIPI